MLKVLPANGVSEENPLQIKRLVIEHITTLPAFAVLIQTNTPTRTNVMNDFLTTLPNSTVVLQRHQFLSPLCPLYPKQFFVCMQASLIKQFLFSIHQSLQLQSYLLPTY